MSAWILVPCLVALRDEFNRLSPNRDKGADGSIGDSSHTSSSDHTPDEDSDVLRDHDADTKNEVHALDIDSTGPWPGATFDAIVKGVIARERKRWLDPNDKCRLHYVIWNRRIYSQSNDFNGEPYTLSDPHTNHAHFSSRYETSCESDTRPWGVWEDDDMTKDELKAWMTEWAKSAAGREALAVAVLAYDPGLVDGKVPLGAVQNYGDNAATNPTVQAAWSIGRAQVAEKLGYQVRDRVDGLEDKVDRLEGKVDALAARDFVDEQAIINGVVAALPEGADQITQDEVTTAFRTVMRDAFSQDG